MKSVVEACGDSLHRDNLFEVAICITGKCHLYKHDRVIPAAHAAGTHEHAETHFDLCLAGILVVIVHPLMDSHSRIRSTDKRTSNHRTEWQHILT